MPGKARHPESGTASGALRIVHLTTLHAPLDVRIFVKEARTAATAGHDVHIVAPGAGGERDGVRFHDLGASTDPGPARLAARLRAARRAARELRADVYHLHEPELIPLALTLKAVVYDAHEETPLEVRAMHPDRPLFGRALSVGWRSAERLVSAAADGIVAATPSIATRFPERKTIVVRNFPTAEEAERFVGGAHAERPANVLYLGGVTAIRGARELAAAIERVAEPARLVLAGPVDTGFEFGPRVELRGSLGRDEVAALLREARVGLLVLHPVAAHLESLPIKLFEYMAAGIPVVASAFPLWRELIGGAGVLVDPHDVDAIARAIEDLLADPERAEAMGRAGREAVAERFSWEPEGERLLSLYERVASRVRSG
jgi:glycosyltransferase involved in cell wall biosynthesis